MFGEREQGRFTISLNNNNHHHHRMSSRCNNWPFFVSLKTEFYGLFDLKKKLTTRLARQKMIIIKREANEKGEIGIKRNIFIHFEPPLSRNNGRIDVGLWWDEEFECFFYFILYILSLFSCCCCYSTIRSRTRVK